LKKFLGRLVKSEIDYDKLEIGSAFIGVSAIVLDAKVAFFLIYKVPTGLLDIK